MPPYKVLTAGDTGLVIEFGDGVDRQLSAWVLALARRLNEARLEGITETVPTFRSLMVYYDPIALASTALVARIVELMEGVRTSESAGRLWHLPVCYDSELAPDLGDVAARTARRPWHLQRASCRLMHRSKRSLYSISGPEIWPVPMQPQPG
jgi:allophanate hydrolase subunit 1